MFQSQKKIFTLLCLFILSINLSAEREAVTSNEKELVEAVSENFETLAERLISENVPVDITDDYGQSLLMFAAKNNNEKLVKLLINKGANPNYEINEKSSYNENKSALRMLFLNGLTVLDYGVESNSISMIDLLIELGAKLDVDNKDLGSTVAEASKRNNVSMVRYLLSKGAQVSDITGQYLVVWHILRRTNSIYGETSTKSIDFSIVKIWDDYGVPLDDEILTTINLLRKERDRVNVVNYMKSYRAWLADGAKMTQRMIREQNVKVIPKMKNEAEMDSILSEAKLRAENEEPSTWARDRLEKRRDKVKQWTIFFVVIALIIWVVYNKRTQIIPFVQAQKNIIKQQFARRNQKRTTIINSGVNIEPTITSAIPKNHKPNSNSNNDKGWKIDDTVDIEVTYLTIEDLINPIRLLNEHERAIREMIWHIRRIERNAQTNVLEVFRDEKVVDRIQTLLQSVDPSNVRYIYKKSLHVLVFHYSKKDKRFESLLDTFFIK